MGIQGDRLEAAIAARDRAAAREAQAFAELDRHMKSHGDTALAGDPELEEVRDTLEAYEQWEQARAELDAAEREVFRLRSFPSNDNDTFHAGP